MLPQLNAKTLELWTESDCDRSAWAHPSVSTVNRRARADKLGAHADSTISGWLESIAAPTAPAASILALRLAAVQVGDADPIGAREPVRTAKIVLTESKSLTGSDTPVLRIHGPHSSGSSNLIYVHPSLEENPDAAAFLVRLGIKRPDALTEFQAYAPTSRRIPGGYNWTRFGVGRAALTQPRAARVIRPIRHRISVMTVSGAFVKSTEVLLPGRSPRGTIPPTLLLW